VGAAGYSVWVPRKRAIAAKIILQDNLVHIQHSAAVNLFPLVAKPLTPSGNFKEQIMIPQRVLLQ
jgi:hypothetical protein